MVGIDTTLWRDTAVLYWNITMLSISMFFLNRCTPQFKEAIEVSIDKKKI
jgi:hypothetical protein